MWVIWNKTQRAYVTPAGSERSYTKLLQRARVFHAHSEAERECCGDEVVRDLRDIMGGM